MTPRMISPFASGERAAFTLAELLSAIAVIAILLALLFPVASKMREGGNVMKCLSNMRQAALGVNAWSVENRNLLPVTGDNTADDEYSWVKRIAPYLGIAPDATRADILCCPSDPTTRATAKPRQPRSYRYNNTMSTTGVRFNTPTLLTERSRFDIKNAATCAMLFDVSYTGPTQLKLFATNTYIWAKAPYDTTSYPPSNPAAYPRPHYDNKAVNLVFYDGHAEKMEYPLPDRVYHFDY